MFVYVSLCAWIIGLLMAGWSGIMRFSCYDENGHFVADPIDEDWVNTYCNVAGQACQRASLQPLRVGTQNNHPQHSNELMMSKGMRYANQPFRGLEDVLQDWVNTYCNVAGQACQRASLQPLRVGTQNNHPQHSNE
ncbi:unnamed protein product, partial [Cuscuta campestris]